MNESIFIQKKAYKAYVKPYTKLDIHLATIFKEFNNSLFETYDVNWKMPAYFNMPETKVSEMSTGKFRFYNGKRRDGDYYLKITVNTHDGSNEKTYRDKLVKELRSKGVEMEVGDRMKLSVRTRSLLFEYRHLIKSIETINKFKL